MSGFLDRDSERELERGLGGSWSAFTREARPVAASQETACQLQRGIGMGRGSGVTTVTVVYDAQLQNEVETLKKEVQELKEAFLQQSQAGRYLSHIVELRDISYDQAKQEIAKYFEAHHGENIDAADLQEALGIEIEIAIQVCEELEKEAKIKAS